MDFARIITDWYRLHRRDLPWRRTKDPYRIWLSEVILQQTRVDQGLPYYQAFTEKFPDVKSLARAKEDAVLRTWQGLGYYSRARNLHHTAKVIASELNGQFPDNSDGLLRLKGVGEYTAAAIASICYNEKKAVVDGNVYRVLARVFGIETPIDSTEGKKVFRELANELLDHHDAGEYNQAVMEFGARQCVPKNPDCSVCPFVQHCVARKKKLISTLPVKGKKNKVKHRYFDYLLLRYRNEILISKRTGNDIWKGLYEFPLIEHKKAITEKGLLASKEFTSAAGKNDHKIIHISRAIKHLLSHQQLHIRFTEIELKKKIKMKNAVWVKRSALKKYAFPIILAKYLDN